MIITCKECSTKFEIDETLLDKKGSKVKCSVCKNIFTVYPAASPKELDIEEDADVKEETTEMGSYFDREEGVGAGDELGFDMEDVDLELGDDEDDDFEIDDDEFEVDEDEFDLDDGAVEADEEEIAESEDEEDEEEIAIEEVEEDQEPEEPGPEIEEVTADSEESDVAGGLAELPVQEDDDSEIEEIDDSPVEGVEPLSLEEMGDDEDQTEFEFDVEEKPEGIDMESYQEDDGDIGDVEVFELGDDEEEDLFGEGSLYSEEEYDVTKYDDVLGTDTETDEDEFSEMFDTEAGDTDQDISDVELFSLDDDAEPVILDAGDADENGDDETSEIDIVDISDGFEDYDMPAEEPKNQKVGKPVLFLLAVTILLLIGYGATVIMGIDIYNLSPGQIPFVGKYFKSTESSQQQAGATLSNETVNGRFVNNQNAGKIFVITGEVTNSASYPISQIQVQGTLVTKGNSVSKKQAAFCGNVVSETTLKEASIREINTALNRKSGKNNSNVNVKPRRSIPFMIVFSDLPENLDNFTVKVLNFQRSS